MIRYLLKIALCGDDSLYTEDNTVVMICYLLKIACVLMILYLLKIAMCVDDLISTEDSTVC